MNRSADRIRRLLSWVLLWVLLWVLSCAAALWLFACGVEKNPVRERRSIAAVLGDADAKGFERARRPRPFHFPRDHGAHPSFRSEWWYLTGNLQAADGRRFGYQATFFRLGLTPRPGERASAWAVDSLWMAHAAVTDVAGKKHWARERFSRGNPGMAGAQIHPFRVWVDDWALAAESGRAAAFPWRLAIDTDELRLALNLTSTKPVVLQGDRGLSRKSPIAGNASYYYSLTRLETRGRLRLGGETFSLTGLSWFDREWSTRALDPEQTGWDWFSLQLHSGEELMYYRLRGRDGAHPNSSGTWVDKKGATRVIKPRGIELTPLRWWRRGAGERYPVSWRLRLEAERKDWIVKAVLDDQKMDLTFTYWEGAVVVLDAHSGEERGRGYLEMTGYE